MAAKALTRPDPKSKSNPAGSRSSAVSFRTCRTAAGVADGPMTCITRAATPATWGAAADVPQNELSGPLGRLVFTQSTPVKSGLNRMSVEGKRIVEGPPELQGSIIEGVAALT